MTEQLHEDPPPVHPSDPVRVVVQPPPPPEEPPWWRRWPQRVRDNIDEHLYFWIMLALSVYLFVGVPQITNIWQQWPRWGVWWVGYVVFLIPLLLFYLRSIFVVLDSPLPLPPVPGWASRLCGRVGRPLLVARQSLSGLSQRYRPIRWAGRTLRAVTWMPVRALYLAPNAAAGWLDRLTELPNPAGPPPGAEGEVPPPTGREPWRHRVARHLRGREGGSVVLILGVMALGSGASSDSSLLYPLVGSFCRGLGLLLIGIGLWLLAGRDPSQIAEASWSRREPLLLALGLGILVAGIPFLHSESHGAHILGAVLRALGVTLAGVGGGLLVSGVGGWRPPLRGGVVLALGLQLLLAVAVSDSLAMSSWAGPICRGLGLLLAGVGVGVLVWGTRPRGVPRPRGGRYYTGRMLSWVLVTACLGEFLWLFAFPDWLRGVFSYRLYTIWAILQALTFLVLIGLFLDTLRELYRAWPVRLFATFALVVVFGGFTHWETVSPDEAERHLTPGQVAVARKADREAAKDPDKARNARAAQWFKQLRARIDSIPAGEGPVVLVAASGGGSRAAIFTALTLEVLRRTPLNPEPSLPVVGAIGAGLGGSPLGHGPLLAAAALPPGRAEVPLMPGRPPRTWADNVVVISSVSGGSLATAWYVHRLEAVSQAPLRIGLRDAAELADLRNTTKSELVSHLADLAAGERRDFPDWLDRLAGQLADPHGAVDLELAKRLVQLGVLLPPGGVAPLRAAPLADLHRLQKTLVRQRNELEKRVREQNAPTGPAGPAPTAQTAADADQAMLAVLTQIITRIRRGYFINPHQDEGVPSEEEAFAQSWVLRSKAFDEMCLDFMAPLLRGVLSPTLDRGDALARFWTNRYGWYDATNVNGYEKPVDRPNYKPYHPLVLFNTCDVANGSRVVVGFPAVPDDFWEKVFAERKATHARPRPLNEVAPNFRVSLARAVRLSSNFPFGFRVSVVGHPGKSIHMLDGGVVDNTGLDTIHALFKALQWHAEAPRSPYRADAHAALEELRRRGVVILEIDAGAKPSGTTPWFIDLLGGVREPLGGLDNATYTNAEVVKQFYVNEVRAILKRDLHALNEVVPGANLSLADFNERLGKNNTTVHLTVQCNHYLPSEPVQDPEVMTAWALGPKDKAQIVQRFLIAQDLWQRQCREAHRDVRDNLQEFTAVEALARKEALSQLILALAIRYDELERDVMARKNPGKLRDRKDKLHRQLTRVGEEVTRAADAEVNRSWEALRRRANRTEGLIARGPPAPPVWWKARSTGDVVGMALGKVGPWVADKRDDAQMRLARRTIQKELSTQLKARPIKTLRDPQWKYDYSTNLIKRLDMAPPR